MNICSKSKKKNKRCKMRYLAILLVSLLVLTACQQVDPDVLEKGAGEGGLATGVDKEGKQKTGNKELEDMPSCPASCDDKNNCTEDTCGKETNYECKNKAIPECCGNDLCEEGEMEECDDCPKCAAENECETVEYDYKKQKCIVEKKSPCCGNGKCDIGETYSTCEEDCPNDAVTSLDLRKYPGMMSKKIILAVGDDATGSDIFAATTIGNGLMLLGKETETLTKSKISDLDAQDMIVIGRPCENSIWEELLGVTECVGFLEEDTGIRKLIENNKHFVILMSGDVPENTQTLADVLGNPTKYSLKGEEMTAKISGSKITLS
jgi:hypothetical protein